MVVYSIEKLVRAITACTVNDGNRVDGTFTLSDKRFRVHRALLGKVFAAESVTDGSTFGAGNRYPDFTRLFLHIRNFRRSYRFPRCFAVAGLAFATSAT